MMCDDDDGWCTDVELVVCLLIDDFMQSQDVGVVELLHDLNLLHHLLIHILTTPPQTLLSLPQ
jgi:hypothetical protein